MSGPLLVSIVIPVFDGERFLADAIRSVLAQRHRPIEVIVVDDGSSDDSAGIAYRVGAPVRVWRQANAGPPAARNRGLALARGTIVGFLDADDVYAPDKLALQIPRLEAHPECDLVLGGIQYLDLVGQEVTSDAVFAALPGDHVALALGCGLFRRSLFDRVGTFDETLRYCDDWDWFLRVREAGAGLRLHRHVVLRQRLHNGNLTRRREENSRFSLRVLKRSIDRRRQSGGGGSLPSLASFYEPDELADGDARA
jgi:glycosyltransferase involved in cell wall biosynthesis